MRILFVAFSQSIHAARWISQVDGQGWDIHLMPSVYDWQPLVHRRLRNVTIHGPWAMHRPEGCHPRVRLKGFWPWYRGLNFATGLVNKCGRLGTACANRYFPGLLRIDAERRLADLVDRLKPDIVHSLEMQHGAYLTLAAKELLGGKFPPWIVSNWGSDIYYFGQLREHQEKIEAVLAACDYYTSEAQRDVPLAQKFGFKGQILPVLPAAGGLDIARCQRFRMPGPTSKRRLILLKGSQNRIGRALTGLRAIELCADYLRNYRIGIYSASPEMPEWAEILSNKTGIPMDVIPQCDHDAMLRWRGCARISIGLNISDGLSTSFLESLAMGAFPIQAYTAAADEWIRDGETGFIVHPEDPESVAVALRRAVMDDELVDRAASANLQVARERLDVSVIQPQVVAMYQAIANERGDGGSSPLTAERGLIDSKSKRVMNAVA